MIAVTVAVDAIEAVSVTVAIAQSAVSAKFRSRKMMSYFQ
jgi:hypothetical protein